MDASTMSMDDLAPQVRELLDSIVDDEFRAQVKEIEAKTQVTRNHYGEYMHLLNASAQGDKGMGRIIALALIHAGANQQGVKDAYRIVFGG